MKLDPNGSTASPPAPKQPALPLGSNVHERPSLRFSGATERNSPGNQRIPTQHSLA